MSTKKTKTKADLEAENAALTKANERLKSRVLTLEVRDVEKTAALNVYRDMYEQGLVEEMSESRSKSELAKGDDG